MSGTGWSYVAPYQDDIEKALEELRQDVFDRGEYERPRDALDNLNDFEGLGFFSTDERGRREIIAEFSAESLNVLIERVGVAGLRTELRSLTDAPVLTRIDDLRALQCLSADGTHSILDITRVASEPGFGAVVPVPPEEVIRLFGTDKPNRQMIEDALRWGKLDPGPRWQAVCLIAYDDDRPTSIYFVGSSGD